MLRLTPFVLLFVFTIMRAPAGEVHYEPTEDTMACADMVVIAKQSGDIGKFTPQSDERRTHKEVFDSDFEVLRVIKKCNLAKDPKVIRIHGTEHRRR